MGVAAEIDKHMLGSAEGCFSVGYPFYFAQRDKVCGEGLWHRKPVQVTVKRQLPCQEQG